MNDKLTAEIEQMSKEDLFIEALKYLNDPQAGARTGNYTEREKLVLLAALKLAVPDREE